MTSQKVITNPVSLLSYTPPRKTMAKLARFLLTFLCHQKMTVKLKVVVLTVGRNLVAVGKPATVNFQSNKQGK